MKMKEKLSSYNLGPLPFEREGCIRLTEHFSIDRQLLSNIDMNINDDTSVQICSETKLVTYNPQARKYRLKTITDQIHNKRLASILNVHSYSVPLVVSFNLQQCDDDELKVRPTVCAVYHCPHCHIHWESSKKLPLVCNETTLLVYGKSTAMTVDEAFMFIDVLNWTKKFACTQLKNAFPLLRKRTTSIERNLLIKAISKLMPVHAKDTEANRKEILGLAVEKAIKLRNYIFLSLLKSKSFPIDSDLKKVIDEFEGAPSILGLKSKDGCFYPGFFIQPAKSPRENDSTASNDSDSSFAPELGLINVKFAPNGKFDKDGRFYRNTIANIMGTSQFPSLGKLVESLSRKKKKSARKSAAKNIPSPVSLKYRFCFHGGHELDEEGHEFDIGRLFKSGIWYVDGKEQFLFGGFYNAENRFIASYCITNTGVFIPGSTNDLGSFYPLSKYVSSENNPVKLHIKEKKTNSYKKSFFFDKVYSYPRFPKKFEIVRMPNWICFKNLAFVDDPSLLTVPCNDMYANENLNVYIGGEKGPDKRLYLYGRYDQNQFFTGGPPVTFRQSFAEIPDSEFDDLSYQGFSKRFGIYFNDSSSNTDIRKHTSLPSYVCEGYVTVQAPSNSVSMDEKRLSHFREKKTPSDKQLTNSVQVSSSRKIEPYKGLSLNKILDVEAGSKNGSVSKSKTFLEQSLEMNSELGSSGMSWFTNHQKKLYEVLSRPEISKTGSSEKIDQDTKSQLKLTPSSRISRVDYTMKKQSLKNLMKESLLFKESSAILNADEKPSSSDHVSRSTNESPRIGYSQRTLSNAPLSSTNFDLTEEQVDSKRDAQVEIMKFNQISSTLRGQDFRNIVEDSLSYRSIQTAGFDMKNDGLEISPNIAHVPAIMMSEQHHSSKHKKTKSKVRKEKKAFQSGVANLQDRKTKKLSRLGSLQLINNVEKSKQLVTNLEVPRLTLPCNDQTVTGSEKEMNISNFLDSQSSKHNEEAINYIKNNILKGSLSAEKQWMETRSTENKTLTQSSFFPNLNNFSSLVFTDHRFSYFTMPEHVKDFNHKMTRGSIKLPLMKDDTAVKSMNRKTSPDTKRHNHHSADS